MANYRKDYDGELLKVFNVAYKDYLKDNKGYLNILEYLKGIYGFNPIIWEKIARMAKIGFMKRKGVIYFKA